MILPFILLIAGLVRQRLALKWGKQKSKKCLFHLITVPRRSKVYLFW